MILSNRNHDSMENDEWIIPTCTYFLCDLDKKIGKNHHYIFFCTHPNQHEINQLKALVTPIQEIPCRYQNGMIGCLKESLKNK